jgi:NNP family nitrate/nitrite transporter-like MFS transporter
MDNNTVDGPNKKNNRETNSIILLLFFLTSIFFINFTIRIILSPLMPTILTDMNLTSDQAGSFFLISASGYFISLICSGFVSSILKHKKTILLTTVVSGLAIISTGLSQNLMTIRLGLFVVGMATGLYLPSGIALLTAAISSKNWGKGLGIHEIAPNLSFLLAPLICEGLLLWVSWRSILIIIGVVSIGFGIAFYSFSTIKDFSGEAPMFSSLKPLVSTSSFWMMVTLFSLGVTGTLGIYSMLPLYLVKVHGMTQTDANTLVTLSRVLTLPMGLIAGWLTDRIGIKQTLASILFFSGILTLFIGILTGFPMKVIIFCQPLLAVCFFPPAFAALSKICTKETRNIAISFTIPIGFLLGGGVIPHILGVLGKSGHFSTGFVIFGTLIFFGSVIPFFLKLLKEKEV